MLYSDNKTIEAYFTVSGRHLPGVYCESGVMKGCRERKDMVAAHGAHGWARTGGQWMDKYSAGSREMWSKYRYRAAEAQHVLVMLWPEEAGGGMRKGKQGRRERRRARDFKTGREEREERRTKYKYKVQRKIPYPLLHFVTCKVRSDRLSHLILPRSLRESKICETEGRRREGRPTVKRRDELGSPQSASRRPAAGPNLSQPGYKPGRTFYHQAD